MKYEVRDATPEEFEAWRKTDYWNKMDFDPLVMFVVIPTIIQLLAVGMMGAVMYINSIIF
tara:strand:- start:396 stop:575 length:180 start_codon:yes stop_codon:yes gene_type:complete